MASLLVAELILPNLPSRLIAKVARQLNPPVEEILISEEVSEALFVSNEFLFMAERIANLPVQKVAGIHFDNRSRKFTPIEQDAIFIQDINFANNDDGNDDAA